MVMSTSGLGGRYCIFHIVVWCGVVWCDGQKRKSWLGVMRGWTGCGQRRMSPIVGGGRAERARERERVIVPNLIMQTLWAT